MVYKFRHLNKQERELAYPLICQKQGFAFCNECGATRRSLEANGLDSKLLIDRIDNTKGYWDQNQKTGQTILRLDNLQLVCRGCNKRKEYRMPKISERPMTPEMMVNRSKEPYFRKWVHGMIETSKNNHIEYDEAIDSGSEFVGISIETAKRYIRKMISKSGEYELGWGKNGGTFIYEKGMAPREEPFSHITE